jgi:hypothetical protein
MMRVRKEVESKMEGERGKETRQVRARVRDFKDTKLEEKYEPQ